MEVEVVDNDANNIKKPLAYEELVPSEVVSNEQLPKVSFFPDGLGGFVESLFTTAVEADGKDTSGSIPII